MHAIPKLHFLYNNQSQAQLDLIFQFIRKQIPHVQSDKHLGIHSNKHNPVPIGNPISPGHNRGKFHKLREPTSGTEQQPIHPINRLHNCDHLFIYHHHMGNK